MSLFGKSKTLLWVLSNLVSGVMVLWSSRAFHLHAYLAGWGDASADKEQSVLWWICLVSLILFSISVVVSAVYSSRYRRSFLGGAAITGTLWWLSGLSATNYLGYLLLVGWFAQASVFGVHADLDWGTAPLCWMLGINLALYASVIALIPPGVCDRVLKRRS